MKTDSLSLIRLPELKAKLGHLQTSTIYSYMEKGLLPRPIKLGGRNAFWIGSEIDELIAQALINDSDDKIRAKVTELMKRRAEFSTQQDA